MDAKDYINEVIEHYDLGGKLVDFDRICDGNINKTYTLKIENGTKYLLQMINTNVFKNPDELMQNIVGVTKYMQSVIAENGGDAKREALNVIFTKDGNPYFTASDGTVWRIYDFITNAYTCQIIDNPEVFKNAGKAFGDFMRLLADYHGESLFETIPDFHNTKSRFNNLLNAIENNLSKRKDNVAEEIKFALDREKDASVLVDLLDEGKLPIRVTHNDTKINNIMFDNETNEAICVLDLDTVMPGLSLYDFGDAIRSGASTAAEDEKDLSKVTIDLNLYKKYTEGYLSSAGKSLTELEVEYLPFSAKLLSFECGMRFLTDYLDGDTYFKTEYPEQNLYRCRTQFKLVKDIEEKFDEMKKITEDIYRSVLA